MNAEKKEEILSILSQEQTAYLKDHVDLWDNYIHIVNSGTNNVEDIAREIIKDINEAMVEDETEDNGVADKGQEVLSVDDTSTATTQEYDWKQFYTQYVMRSDGFCHAGIVVKRIPDDITGKNTYYIRQCKRKKDSKVNSTFCKQHDCMTTKFVYDVEYGDDDTIVDAGIKVEEGKEPTTYTSGSIKDIFSSAYTAASRAEQRVKAKDYNVFLTKLKELKQNQDDRWKEKMSAHATSLAQRFENLTCGNKLPNIDAMFNEDEDVDCDDDAK